MSLMTRRCNGCISRYVWQHVHGLQITPKYLSHRATRNFSVIHRPKLPRPLKGRLLRRLLFGSALFGIWFFTVDADFVTYALDSYRRHSEQWLCKQLSTTFPPLSHPNDLSDKNVWIIGASSGIGEYIAYNLCELNEGAPHTVILSARRTAELERVAAHCRTLNANTRVLIRPIDITQFADESHTQFGDAFVDDLVRGVDDDIDVCILNSGMIQKCRGEYASMASFKQLAEINMMAPIGVIQSMIKQWRRTGVSKQKHKKHQIVLTSSFVGKIGSPGYAFYSLTKHGMNGFCESMNAELQNENIRFNVLCLGPCMPSKATHAELGGQVDVKHVRQYTDKYGNVMQLQRCAQLYVTAIQYNLREAWITVNPYLFYLYSRQYVPLIALSVVDIFAKPFVRDVHKSDNNNI